MLSLDTLRILNDTPQLLDALAARDLSEQYTLALLSELRAKWPPEIAAAALQTARLRQQAIIKFDRAGEMFFTPDGLQQATAPAVRTYHAEQLAHTQRVVDIGCGIGADSLALGQSASVIGFDIDPVRVHIARHNARVYRARADFLVADARQPWPLRVKGGAFFFDPARRANQRRLFSVKDYIPPLATLHGWPLKTGLVKLSPGVDTNELAPYEGGLTFVSEQGNLKEALLGLGDFAFAGRRAVLLPQHIMLQTRGLPAPPVRSAPLRYMLEPDPAIIRAGCFGELAAHLTQPLFRLDEQIAYLTSDAPIDSPWCRQWHVIDWMPFNLKRLRASLRQQGIGRVTVKKRGSPLTPEALQARLALKHGDREAVIFLTQIMGKHSAVICDTP
ncbi:MAG: THUMP-like domain-containing protein [Anaerolineales bacterium]